MVMYELLPTSRFKCYIYKQQKPKRFRSKFDGHEWTLRDMTYSNNVVLPNFRDKPRTLKESKRQAMLAYLLWFTVRLIRGTDDPRVIDGEFLRW